MCCAFTGVSAEEGDGIHIITYKRSSEVCPTFILRWHGVRSSHFLRSLQWYWKIIANRPKDRDNVAKLRDINDIQNRVFVGTNIHRPFDARRQVFLKVCCFCLAMFPPSHLSLAVDMPTPNHILSTADMLQRHQRPIMPGGVRYPTNARYTLNWLKTPDNVTLLAVMLRLKHPLRSQNHRTFYCTITIAPQPSNGGGRVWMSSRTSPTLLVHLYSSRNGTVQN